MERNSVGSWRRDWRAVLSRLRMEAVEVMEVGEAVETVEVEEVIELNMLLYTTL